MSFAEIKRCRCSLKYFFFAVVCMLRPLIGGIFYTVFPPQILLLNTFLYKIMCNNANRWPRHKKKTPNGLIPGLDWDKKLAVAFFGPDGPPPIYIYIYIFLFFLFIN